VTMQKIDLQNVSVDFPVFNANGRSLTSRLLEVATGGRLDSDPSGHIQVKALDGITLTIKSGDRVALLGNNGAGKSTLLRTINGVYAPTTGSINIQGAVGSLIDIGLGINPEASGRENIFVRGALLGFSKSQIREKIDSIIEFSAHTHLECI
jgi:lipopolysaccharide transport system ATP-binding protein